jgi:glycosyltransferase involved in cell wall biosynthesis
VKDAPLVVVQRRLVHYRVPFFEALREALAAQGTPLRLLAGPCPPAEHDRQDQGHLPWAEPVPTRYLLGGRLCWMQLAPLLAGAGWVVLPQENRLAAQWPLLLRPQPFRVAVWGHGTNLQAPRPGQGAAHQWRRRLLRGADWALAYTEASVPWMRAELPRERITVLDNAVDTRALQHHLSEARTAGVPALRRALGLGPGPVLLFLGALVPHKGVDVALQAASQLRVRFPTLELVVAGSGPLGGWLAEAAGALPWVHRPGAVHGADKARWLAAADVMVNPGQVGLGVFDGFAAGLPLVTCQGIAHPPEAAYLRHEVNALLVAPGPDAVARAVQGLLDDPEGRNRLGRGALDSASRHTLKNMVSQFVTGVAMWQASAPRRPDA